MLPHEKAGVFDVVWKRKPHENAVARGASVARGQLERSFARTSSPIDQAHPKRRARVAAGIAILDGARDLIR
jgi:hypothetical protein